MGMGGELPGGTQSKCVTREREPKHLAMETALIRLDNSLCRLAFLENRIQYGENPPTPESDLQDVDKKPIPSLGEFLNIGFQRVEDMTSYINERIDAIEEMLF